SSLRPTLVAVDFRPTALPRFRERMHYSIRNAAQEVPSTGFGFVCRIRNSASDSPLVSRSTAMTSEGSILLHGGLRLRINIQVVPVREFDTCCRLLVLASKLIDSLR